MRTHALPCHTVMTRLTHNRAAPGLHSGYPMCIVAQRYAAKGPQPCPLARDPGQHSASHLLHPTSATGVATPRSGLIAWRNGAGSSQPMLQDGGLHREGSMRVCSFVCGLCARSPVAQCTACSSPRTQAARTQLPFLPYISENVCPARPTPDSAARAMPICPCTTSRFLTDCFQSCRTALSHSSSVNY